MDLRAYGFSSKSSVPTCSRSESTGSESGDEIFEPSSPKRLCTIATSKPSQRSKLSDVRKYNKKWEQQFPWLEYDEHIQGVFCRECKKYGNSSQRTGGAWITKPFTNWKKAVEKMRAHSKSDVHIQSCEASLLAERATRQGTIIQQLQHVADQDRLKNRRAIKALIRCTHFLARQHIAHTTNFDKLVDLIVACGGQDIKIFLETAARNASYTSKNAVIDFVNAIGTWVEESLLKRVCEAQFYTIMADECTDVTTIEELSIFCRWTEDGIPVEHFIEIVPMKRADAESIHSALVECLREKGMPLNKIIGMGFDGAATFSGSKTGVQTRLRKQSPHAIFVHCHCHQLQLACVQAANATTGIKHVYVTLTALWKFFHFSPKRAQSLKEVQKVLDLPELKIVKPSDTRWLAHERCVKAVKASYTAIVTSLEHIYQESHEPESLGLKKALCKKSTISAIYLLDYVLPQLAKLSKALQTEKLDLSVVSSVVEATIQSIDDAVLPAANWVLQLLEDCDDLQTATEVMLTQQDITSFQDDVGKPFVALVKENISNRFSSSKDIITSFSIFDPKKVPGPTSVDLTTYGEDSIGTLLDHYGKDLRGETVEGIAFEKAAIISRDVLTEWKTYRQLMTKQPKEDMTAQLKELAVNDTIIALLPNLHKLAVIFLSLPVATASVERSFSHMKMIKTRLRNRIGELSLSNLMKIAIESPDTLSDNDVEEIVSVWNRKNRRIAV